MNNSGITYQLLKKTLFIPWLLLVSVGFAQQPVFQSEIIMPYQNEHVHGSTIVELPNGDLLTAWFQGSGERWGDDVRIMGSRKKYGSDEWSGPFVMADIAKFPDINPALFVDGKNRLWLIWYTVIANQWETSLLKYRISEDYATMLGAPNWDWQADLHVKPGDKTERGIQPDDSFVQTVTSQLDEYKKRYQTSDSQKGTKVGGKERLPGQKVKI